MLLFLLGILGAVAAEERDPLCQTLRSPEHSLLSKEGDITIGGVFSIHSHISSPLLSFTDTPKSLNCSRYYMGLSNVYFLIPTATLVQHLDVLRSPIFVVCFFFSANIYIFWFTGLISESFVLYKQ